jgi:hypothetical protein
MLREKRGRMNQQSVPADVFDRGKSPRAASELKSGHKGQHTARDTRSQVPEQSRKARDRVWTILWGQRPKMDILSEFQISRTRVHCRTVTHGRVCDL